MNNNNHRIIMHIDANSAYLSWQAISNLQCGSNVDLRTIPAAVAGNPKKRNGIILAKSIPAKQQGICTGEPIFQARLKCPELILVPPNFPVYMRCSHAMFKIIKEFSPLVERYSIDECFIDFTNMSTRFEDPVKAAYSLKERIKQELGFTVNVGISTNKLLAKMAGDLKKPDRVHTLFPSEIPQKMHPLPVDKLFMVGRKTTAKLTRLGIKTIGDLATYDVKSLQYKLKYFGLLIHEYANGIDHSPVRPSNRFEMKGLGNSTTIPFDITDNKTAHIVLLSLIETVGMRLRQAGMCSQVIEVSIRYSDFTHYSHQNKIDHPTHCTHTLYEEAKNLFNQAWKGDPIRHLGVRVADLCSEQYFQLSLFDDITQLNKLDQIDQTVDDIRKKFGSYAITRASYLHTRLKPLSGGIGEEGYPVMSSQL